MKLIIIKHWSDYFLASVGLVLISPILLIISFAIIITMGRPVIFKQKRPGMHGIPFYIYKFRTMTNQINESGELLPDGERLTRLGSFLRSTSLDELPELINVLKGDMNLVGPRPLLMKYLECYSVEQNRRHEMKPGITGWAQINGRNAITWEEKFALDLWYIDNWSLWLDTKILCMTVFKVFQRGGVNKEGEATMSEFTGSAASGQCPLITGAEKEAAAIRD